jgi:hypothetical protein
MVTVMFHYIHDRRSHFQNESTIKRLSTFPPNIITLPRHQCYGTSIKNNQTVDVLNHLPNGRAHHETRAPPFGFLDSDVYI